MDAAEGGEVSGRRRREERIGRGGRTFAMGMSSSETGSDEAMRR